MAVHIACKVDAIESWSQKLSSSQNENLVDGVIPTATLPIVHKRGGIAIRRGLILLSVFTLRRGDTHARESLSPSNRGARRHRRYIAHVPSSGVMQHTPEG